MTEEIYVLLLSGLPRPPQWQDFLISAHQQQIEPNEELLRRWLKTECRWPDQTIDHTLEELHTGLELLRKYEQTLPRATYGRTA